MILLLPSRSYRLSVSESPLVRGRSPERGRRHCTCTIGLLLPLPSQSLTFPLAVGIQDLGVSDPLHVAVNVFIQLLALSQLLELSA